MMARVRKGRRGSCCTLLVGMGALRFSRGGLEGSGYYCGLAVMLMVLFGAEGLYMSVSPSSTWALRVSLALGLRWRSFGHLHDAVLCVQRSNVTSCQAAHDGHDPVMRVLSSRMSVWVHPKHLPFPSRKDDMLRKRSAHSFHLSRFKLCDPSHQYQP